MKEYEERGFEGGRITGHEEGSNEGSGGGLELGGINRRKEIADDEG